MFILKFGGSSVWRSPHLLNVLDIIKSHKHSYDTNKVVVLSACKGITDKLQTAAIAAATPNDKQQKHWNVIYNEIETHHLQIIGQTLAQYKAVATQSVSKLLGELHSLLEGISYLNEITPASTDAVLAFGELLSTTLLHYICLENSLPSVLLDTRDMIITDNNYGAARPLLDESEHNIKQAVNNTFNTGAKLIITQGFIASYRGKSLSDTSRIEQIGSDTSRIEQIGSDTSRIEREWACKTTTLGRGGSDYTAALLGAALDAEEIQIWTDVNGILSADPRVCPDACTISQMEFEEVKDISYWGAKVIHPDTILPAIQKNINIKVLNSFNADNAGTVIKSGSCGDSFAVKSIIAKQHCLYLTSRSKPAICSDSSAKSLLYCGQAGGLYVTLLDSCGYSTDCSFKELAKGEFAVSSPRLCSAICITGSNIKQNGNKVWEMLADVLKHLDNAKLNNIIYDFFDNSIILVLSNVNNINDIVQKLHTNIILPFHE